MNGIGLLKEQKVISIREFIKNLSKITSKPENKVYTLVKNGKKVGTYIPEQYEDDIWPTEQIDDEPVKKYNSFFDKFDELSFTTDDPNLSQKVDEIVYGIKK